MVRFSAGHWGEELSARAIITGKESKYNSVADLKGTTFGISRQGRSDWMNCERCVTRLTKSGSQVMVAVLATQEGWKADEQPKYEGQPAFSSSF